MSQYTDATATDKVYFVKHSQALALLGEFEDMAVMAEGSESSENKALAMAYRHAKGEMDIMLRKCQCMILNQNNQLCTTT